MTYRNTVLLPDTTTDQNGVVFTIAGLSGITWAGSRPAAPGPTPFLAVMDNSNKLLRINITFNANGSIASASVAGGISLAVSRDFEGIAPGARDASGVLRTVFLSEEDTPAVLEFRLSDGALVRTILPPAVFAQRRANFGFESCAVGAGWLWNANEEALAVDGGISTPTTGTVVRLLRTSLASTPAPSTQYAYRTQPMHGSTVSGARSGLSDLVALPDGRLIALERSFAFSLAGFFQSRVYEVSFAGATEASGFVAGLNGQTFTTVGKTLLWQGNLNNMEGLTLGPALPSRNRVLVGIVDNGDPISKSAVTSFELSGLGPAAVAGGVGAP